MFNVRFRLFCLETRFKWNKRSIILPAVYPTRHFARKEYGETSKNPFLSELYLWTDFKSAAIDLA